MTRNDSGGLLEAPRMGKARGQIKNTGDPRGQFAAFLRDWIDRKHGGDESRLAGALGVSTRTVQYWMIGEKSPRFEHLHKIATAMGYSDWSKLAAAIIRLAN